MNVADRLQSLAGELPLPAAGNTAERFRRLWAFAAESPSLGRLAEAHFDAVAILSEAGHRPPANAVFGVWAAAGPEPAALHRAADGWRLTGSKQWCSGATLATHALVTAEHGDSNALVLVPLHDAGVKVLPTDWESSAFADVQTRTVAFDVALSDDAIVGVDDWYLTRAGFWHGAVGVAASWAGCAAGLVAQVMDGWRNDPHALVHLGAIDAALWGMRAALDSAGGEIDLCADGPTDGHRRALRVRHLVDTAVGDVTTRLCRALGPAPLAYRHDVHRILAETDLYRRQCHAERDLEQLGALVGPTAS